MQRVSMITQVQHQHLTFVLDQDIRAIVEARCTGLIGNSGSDQRGEGEENRGELHGD